MDEIILYGQYSCSSCHQLKSYLKANEIPHTYYDVEASVDNYDKYKRDFPGSRSVPKAIIVYQDGTEEKLQGANDILKYLRSLEQTAI